MIHLQNIEKVYRTNTVETLALNKVSLDVAKGEFLSIMGPSGCGKSTLLNIIGLLDEPSKGEIRIDDQKTDKLSDKQLANFRNKKLGFIFQSYHLINDLQVLDNVELPLLYNPGIPPKERRERAIHALESVKLAERMDHTPNQLSGGQQQRVAIARALVNEPVMILADEATGNLDSRTSYEIIALMQELNQQNGKTIVFVTHEPDIAGFSSRTVTLKDGKVIKDSPNENRRSAKEVLASLPVSDDY